MRHRLPPCVRRPGGSSSAGYGRSLLRGGAHQAPSAFQSRIASIRAFLVGITLVPRVTEHLSRPARGWNRGIVVLLAAGALATVALRSRPPAAVTVDVPALAMDDAGIPDDGVLREQLQKAIDLRRREFFD